MVIIIMGVSGAGKTTVGQLLAQDLDWPFFEVDHFHPRSNVLKMAQAMALTDEDRWPWLDQIRQLIHDLVVSGQDAVIACSALKQVYRDHLADGNDAVVWVYLKGEYGLIRSRLEDRQEHFMKADLLESQFRTMEEPHGVITLEVTSEPEVVADAVKRALGLG